ncbi:MULTISPECIES: Vmh family MBL fold metallo-hydrolase [Pantoea]|jgi:glyoxylase-like metal-dependent hydrolase (beta-lactamase superfamily II)|uniref:Vmh family MBL fold metallo-hydrolase n=1 Tax=Pantoea TaxID=53335 RepID=UPI00142DD375|nr:MULTISPECIES: Vmh family MBL fold metallo-hydrolase [Pantoea]KAF6638288.1 MBL fold metallo-hydrolase [Pantoea sp. EKM10T]MBD8118005.1 MBL fold metallo-hydrolase [Pantoea agglomerans]MDQ0435189.1 glyoxylase-like metal-dependent hydrolase (beta-lactamase superfamily II) [Pantoea agglomerans]MDQ0550748.1 glyoxylase-like metal-dependent hydrolase (beta-lactamase superfamily II) [Pantoea agglomerans]MDY0901423.1 Vmh family MBL fold metallo-hydrolase [Pantoea agglomerans]
MKTTLLPVMLVLASASTSAATLQLQTYNPQEKGIFAVSSTLVSGPTEAILFDAQFSTQDGEKLAEMIKKSGKTLKEIVITSGDPDFYFGLEPIVKAWPDVKVVAAPAVVKHIQQTHDAKLKYWGPQMKQGAPDKVVVPEVTHQTRFSVDGEVLELRHPEQYAAYIWIPSASTILGGTALSSGIHVWTADTQTVQSRAEWRHILTEMQTLNAKNVIPGHYLGARPAGSQAVDFTLNYLKSFEAALAQHKTSAQVITAMKAAWPKLAEPASLELSAKVNTGEMKW